MDSSRDHICLWLSVLLANPSSGSYSLSACMPSLQRENGHIIQKGIESCDLLMLFNFVVK